MIVKIIFFIILLFYVQITLLFLHPKFFTFNGKRFKKFATKMHKNCKNKNFFIIFVRFCGNYIYFSTPNQIGNGSHDQALP